MPAQSTKRRSPRNRRHRADLIRGRFLLRLRVRIRVARCRRLSEQSAATPEALSPIICLRGKAAWFLRAGAFRWWSWECFRAAAVPRDQAEGRVLVILAP